MTLRLRHRSSSPTAAPTSPPDGDDLLIEILLRLPPLPSSLLRAALVCKRWCGLVSDPGFLRRFRAFHRTPPLLGFFSEMYCIDGIRRSSFTPTLDPPDRVPAARFSLPRGHVGRCRFLGCRHGLALLVNGARREAVVWYPVTGDLRCVPFPPGFGLIELGAVLRAAGDDDHDKGHLSPFKLVLIDINHEGIARMRLYQSDSGVWGDSILTLAASSFIPVDSILVDNALYWLIQGGSILKFDLDRQSLAVISKPADARNTGICFYQHLRTEGKGLGLAVLTKQNMQMQIWERKANSHAVVPWVLQKTIELDKLLVLEPKMDRNAMLMSLGYAEDANVIFLCTHAGTFMIQLESMQFKKLSGCLNYPYYPYTSFFTAGRGICG